MIETGAIENDDALVDLATRLADGESIDWDSEEAKTPHLSPQIRSLRWLEQMGSSRVESSDQTLEMSALETAPASSDSRAEPISLAPGTRWGRLTILEKLGSGGAGDVFCAHDDLLDRKVALKLWRETRSRPTTGTEARRLAKVRHPGILAVHGVDRCDGYAGMWTDMVHGRNLEDILAAEGPLDAAEAVRIGAALCDALAAMHRARLVHRDVKPSNVMREPDGRVILLDFGSVKELLRGVPEYTLHMRGTPLFMAPEALRGEPIGRAADIYSLGVLLYRLVTGADPIEARTMKELRDAHRDGLAVPLQKRRPDLPEAFVSAVEQAMRSEPAKRPKSMEQFRSLLERVEGSRPLPAPARVLQWLRRLAGRSA